MPFHKFHNTSTIKLNAVDSSTTHSTIGPVSAPTLRANAYASVPLAPAMPNVNSSLKVHFSPVSLASTCTDTILAAIADRKRTVAVTNALPVMKTISAPTANMQYRSARSATMFTKSSICFDCWRHLLVIANRKMQRMPDA